MQLKQSELLTEQIACNTRC